MSAAYRTILLDLSAVSYLGVTASLAIDSLCRDAGKQGRQVVIAVADPCNGSGSSACNWSVPARCAFCAAGVKP